MRAHLAPLLWLGVAACGPEDLDEDGDLLLASVEAALGTDPLVADTDGDGLDDGLEELVHFTDPLVADTDGDGLDDGEELALGLDPNDETSRGYLGGWPKQTAAEKQRLREVPPPSIATIGERLSAGLLQDVHDEFVDLYDLTASGKPVVLLVGNSGFHRLTPLWIEEGEDVVFYQEPSAALHNALVNERFWFVPVYCELNGYGPFETDHLRDVWDAIDAEVPTAFGLIDHGYAMWGHVGRPGVGMDDNDRSQQGRLLILDQDMVVRGIDDWAVLEQLLGM